MIKSEICWYNGSRHAHTIPVEWKYYYRDINIAKTWQAVGVAPPYDRKRVTKLLCPCGDIKDITV